VSASAREVFVKVSGITNLEDAMLAVRCRVDGLGFVFARGDPRSISAERCAAIVGALPSHITKIGEFVGSDRQYVQGILSKVNLSAAQIDGPLGADDLVDFETSVIKVFHLASEFDIEVMRNYLVDAFLLEACIDAGTHRGEKLFRWDAAQQATTYGRVILSGGLTPDNIGEAVRFVRPYGVNVSEGVERKPGVLDRDRLRTFVARAKAVRLLDEEDDASKEYP